MKIPAYIKARLTTRRNAATAFLRADEDVREWLDKHGVEVEPCDIGCGSASLFEADESAERILEAIRKA